MNNKKIIFKNLLKTLSNGHKVLDFEKIEALKFPVNLIITERGSKGKTFGMKEHLRKKYQKDKSKAMWLMNSVIQIKREQKTFTNDFFKKSSLEMLPIETIEFWKNCNFEGDTKKVNLELVHKDGKNVNAFIKMLAIPHGEKIKGSREDIATVVYEEFNVGITRTEQQCDNFFSLLHTLENVVIQEQPLKNIWIFGNNKSLNNLILIKLGITHIDKEITTIYDKYGNPLILIIAPKFTQNEVKEITEANKNNWIFQLAQQADEVEHSYFNKSLFDNINNVKQWNLEPNFIENCNLIGCIYTQKRYYAIGTYKGYKYMFNLPERPEGYVYSLNKKDMIEGNVYKPFFKEGLLKMLSNNQLYFADLVTRESIIKIITT